MRVADPAGDARGHTRYVVLDIGTFGAAFAQLRTELFRERHAGLAQRASGYAGCGQGSEAGRSHPDKGVEGCGY